MTRYPLSRWMSVMSCVCLTAATVQPAQAQLAISLDDGGVTVQNGSQPPLVVGPGQSFGGTLTPQGFQGVMSDSRGTRMVQPGVKNPFRDAKPMPATTSSKPLQINAGGVSVSLPGVSAPPAPMMAKPEPLTMQQLAAVKHLARTAEPATALAEVDRMLVRCPLQCDLLQLKAVLLMEMSRPKEAAACAYEAMARGPLWTWPMLRSCFASRDAAERVYRDLQAELQDQPTPDRQLLLAWWERMLGHDQESVLALEQAMAAFPSDKLMPRLHEDWPASLDTEAPPAAQP